MPRLQNGQVLARANAMEEEDINAPLMRQMKGLSIKLDRLVVENVKRKNELHAEKKSSVVPEPAKRRGRQPSKKTDKSPMPQGEETDSDESQSNAIASTSQPAKRRGRQPTKKTAGSPLPQMVETNSDEPQSNAAASTSQPTKRRVQQPKKKNVEAKKRSLRSNSSVEDVSFESPEKRTKRKKRNQPQKLLQRIDSDSTDDEQMMAHAKKNKNVTRRQNEFPSTDEDDSISQVDNESLEMTHLDEGKSGTSKIAHSAMVRDKKPFKDMIESSGSEMTPLLSEKRNSPKSKSHNSSPESEVLVGHGPKTLTENTIDKPMDETPRNASKSKKSRRASIDHGQAAGSSNYSNRQDSEDIVNETSETTDSEQSNDDEAAQKNARNHSPGSVFDTPDEMESDDNEGRTGMNVSNENHGETSAMSIEENNNGKVSSKQTATANEVQNNSAHQENVATINVGSAAMPKNVINELVDVLKVRNDLKKTNDVNAESIHDAVRDEGPSNLFAIAEDSFNDKNAMDTFNVEADDDVMIFDSDGGNDLEEPGPSTLNVSLPRANNKRKLCPVNVSTPARPGPFMPNKIPTYTRNGFLEETFYDTSNDGIFVFNAKPDECIIAMGTMQSKKRQRIIEIEPDEVIYVKRSKRFPKNRKAKKVLERRVSD